MDTVSSLTSNTEALVALITSVLGLFEQYPLNLLLTGSLVYYAMKIIGRGKKTAGGPT